jgi:nitrous oxidase accessory protein NosD
MEKIMLKSKRVVIDILSISLMLCFLGLSSGNLEFAEQIKEPTFTGQEKLTIKSSGFWNLTGVLIDVDGDASGVGAHNWTWAESQDWCNGLGTEEEPYVIENVTINANSGETAIKIVDSDKFFSINNCTLNSLSADRGIRLDNIIYGEIKSCQIERFSFGVTYNNVNNTCMIENDIYDNLIEGCYVMHSNFNQFALNNIRDHTGAGLAPAIYIGGSSCYNNFTDNILINNKRGVYIVDQSNFNEFRVNQIWNNSQNGIEVSGSDYNMFYDNNISTNSIHGIVFNYDSSHNHVQVNSFMDNGFSGVALMNNASNNEIENNEFESNGNGVYIYSNVRKTEHNIIVNNEILNSDAYGIYFWGNGHEVSSNQILNNTIKNSVSTGIYFRDITPNNNIVGNIFMANAMHVLDESTNNFWNNTEYGNFWDNYMGTDADFDGIGDQPHIFTGGIDYLPIYNAVPQIDIISPLNDTQVGQDAPSFIIRVIDRDIDTIWYVIGGYANVFKITSNGTIDAVFWQSIWDDFSDEELILITFFVNDTFGRIAMDHIQLIIDKFLPTLPSGVPGFEIFTLTLLIFVSVILIAIKTRKK